jgi:two-component system, cell cycle response regulator
MKILIADDEESSRKLLKVALTNWGYEPIMAKDGQEAWNLIQQEEFSLVILDILMPEMDGLEVCKRVRQIDYKESITPIYIILLTSKGDKEDVVTGIEAGADDYLPKPFHLDELRVRLQVGVRIMELQRGLADRIKELEIKQSQLLELNRMLGAMASTDGLTTLKNHQAFQEKLSEEVSRSLRFKTPLSVLLIDVDHFKQFNDTFGHLEGDKVLKRVSALLLQGSRTIDFVARYGGEEFAIVLPNTDAEGAMTVAERIRMMIEKESWEKRKVTVSIGISTLNSEFNSPTQLISIADKALYHSKHKGRNLITHINQLVG